MCKQKITAICKEGVFTCEELIVNAEKDKWI